jgi:hypothetical protein
LKRKLLLYFLALILVLGALSLYVGLNARRELNAARGILGTPSEDLSSDDVRAARKHLEAADDILSGPPAAVLRLVPVARQNILAVDAVVDAGIPVIQDALAVIETRDGIDEQELVSDGRVRLEVLEGLSEPLRQQLESLRELETELVVHRSGWLVPPLWDTVDAFASRASDLRRSAERATQALEIAPSLLGADGRRTYLVLLLNNAELRGAGGILSALGTISARNGRLSLGEFLYYAELSPDNPKPVPAPEDFKRRFGRYRADTTTVVNATASADIPEVATVAGRLIKRLRGIEVDGALLIDPRGIASLLPPDSEIAATEGDARLTGQNLTDFIYSDSYDVLGGEDPGRRSAILSVGRDAFKTILTGGSSSAEIMESAGEAVAGRQIRFVSFDDSEQNILDDLGVTGNLTTNAVDNLLVTVQNLGADKLDYWMRRDIEHKCAIDGEIARCESTVRLSNETPRGLNDYVTQINNRVKRSHRYGAYVGYLEVYVPDEAELTSVTLNRETETFYPESENGRKSLGMYFSTPRGERTTAGVSYDLKLPESGYSLEIAPQPLAFDAALNVDLSGPEEWSITGPGEQNEGRIVFRGELDRALRYELRPSARTGISALWTALVRFWTQPIG